MALIPAEPQDTIEKGIAAYLKATRSCRPCHFGRYGARRQLHEKSRFQAACVIGFCGPAHSLLQFPALSARDARCRRCERTDAKITPVPVNRVLSALQIPSQQAVDKLISLLGGILFGQFHGFIDRKFGRYIQIHYFKQCQAQNGKIHFGDALKTPFL